MDNKVAEAHAAPASGPLSHAPRKHPCYRPCSRLPGTCRRLCPTPGFPWPCLGWPGHSQTFREKAEPMGRQLLEQRAHPGTPRTDGRHVSTQADPHSLCFVAAGRGPGVDIRNVSPPSGPRQIPVSGDDPPHSRPEAKQQQKTSFIYHSPHKPPRSVRPSRGRLDGRPHLPPSPNRNHNPTQGAEGTPKGLKDHKVTLRHSVGIPSCLGTNQSVATN